MLVHFFGEKVDIGELGVTIEDAADDGGLNASMDDADAIDPDLIDLVIQLCTRIGMIMEDASPLALNASQDGLEVRVAEGLCAIRTMTPLADAVPRRGR